MSSLAEYNNNPGNLKPPEGVTYDGQIGVDDKGFAVFESPEYGNKALVNDIQHKLDRGVNTPNALVDLWSPAGKENSEESRDNYKIHLANQFGLDATNKQFPENSAENIARAIAQFESGTWKPAKNPDTKVEEDYSYGPTPIEKSRAETSVDQQQQKDLASKNNAAAVGVAAGTALGAGVTGGSMAKHLIDAANIIRQSHGVPTVSTQVLPTSVQPSLTPSLDVLTGTPVAGDKWSTKVVGSMGPGGESVTEAARNYQMQQGLTPEEAAKFKVNRSGLITPNSIPESVGALPAAPSEMSGALKSIPIKAGKLISNILTSAPIKGGLSGLATATQAQDAYNRAHQGDTSGAITSGIGATASAVAPFVGKTNPYLQSIPNAIDAVRRGSSGDYTGAAIDAISTIGPYAAWALGPEVGIPVALATAYGAPAVNAARDYYRSKTLKQTNPSP
jgi:hypothetical protein